MAGVGPILEIRALIVATLAAAFPGVSVAEHHRSEFTPADLDLALKDGNVALRVAFAGVLEAADISSHEEDAFCAWAVFIVTKDVKDIPRDVSALRIASEVMRLASIGDWGETEIAFRKGQNTQLRPLYQGESDVRSAMLWAVTWKQLTVFPTDVNPDDLRKFTSLITRYDITPADGLFEATDTISMATEDP